MEREQLLPVAKSCGSEETDCWAPKAGEIDSVGGPDWGFLGALSLGLEA